MATAQPEQPVYVLVDEKDGVVPGVSSPAQLHIGHPAAAALGDPICGAWV